MIENNAMTEKELQELKELYVERLIENMDTRTLEMFVFDQMLSTYNDLNEKEFIAEISEFIDEDEVADLIESVSGAA